MPSSAEHPTNPYRVGRHAMSASARLGLLVHALADPDLEVLLYYSDFYGFHTHNLPAAWR